jgi:hypothetical protein
MNPLMSVVSFTVLTTHFILGDTPPRPITAKMTPGAQYAMELAAELHGGPVFPVMPALVTSTDDSTLFICEGEQPTGKVERIWMTSSSKEHTAFTILMTTMATSMALE